MKLGALLNRLDTICVALQYDHRGLYGAETLQPIRDAIDLLKPAEAVPGSLRVTAYNEAGEPATLILRPVKNDSAGRWEVFWDGGELTCGQESVQPNRQRAWALFVAELGQTTHYFEGA